MSKKQLPEINAGAMADIAFLLLIFFLVTTTMDVDSGILRKIAPPPLDNFKMDVNARNILEVNINSNNELFVDNKIVVISELKEMALNFIDNGGGVDSKSKNCDWCKGARDPKSSDHPAKAIIAISPDREASYETYIHVLDNVNQAYTILRNRLAKELYGASYTELLGELKNGKSSKEAIQEKVNFIRERYPLLISDTELLN